MGNSELTTDQIKQWAISNPKDAVAVGQFIVKAMGAKKPPPFPDDFDESQEEVCHWAKAHPIRARALFVSLLIHPKIRPHIPQD